MPRLAIDYSKSLIYKICCKDTNITDCYIGSTTNFTNRKNQHKSNCNSNSNSKKGNLKVYRFIREYGGWDNWDMILIEKYPCADKLELLKKEREYIENLKPSLNGNIPNRSHSECLRDNADKYKQVYTKNYKEKYSYSRKEKIGCRTCKCMVRKCDFKKHTKTKKHIDNLP